MCYIIEINVPCPFKTKENLPSKGDLIIHSPGNYTWESEDGHRAIYVDEDGSMELQGDIPLNTAKKLAVRRNQPIEFNDVREFDSNDYLGVVYPNGKTEFEEKLG